MTGESEEPKTKRGPAAYQAAPLLMPTVRRHYDIINMNYKINMDRIMVLLVIFIGLMTPVGNPEAVKPRGRVYNLTEEIKQPWMFTGIGEVTLRLNGVPFCPTRRIHLRPIDFSPPEMARNIFKYKVERHDSNVCVGDVLHNKTIIHEGLIRSFWNIMESDSFMIIYSCWRSLSCSKDQVDDSIKVIELLKKNQEVPEVVLNRSCFRASYLQVELREMLAEQQ